jgi:8-oxo-dGTP diphosphatase
MRDDRRIFPRWPILCAGAVIVEDSSVLLVRRGHAPQKGDWTLPGGMVELGEKVEDAVRREVLEETALAVKPVALLSVFERIIRKTNAVQYHYVVLDYACRRIKGRLRAGSDVSHARWVQRQDLTKYGLTRAVQQVIAQGFEVIADLK